MLSQDRDDGRDASSDKLQLGWQFEAESSDDLMPNQTPARKNIDYLLPTESPWYIDNLSCGELLLSYRDIRISSKALNDLVIQAPLLDSDDRLAVAQQLLAQGLHEVIPSPQQIPAMQDFAELHFRYDGELVSTLFLPARRASVDAISA